MIAILKFMWAWALPFVGPWIARAWPWLPSFRLSFGSLIPLAMVCAAGFGAFWLLRLAPAPPRPVMIAASEVEAAALRAENASLKNAVAEADATRALREAADAHLDDEIRNLTEELAHARDASPTSSAPVFAADDPWLRAKQR